MIHPIQATSKTDKNHAPTTNADVDDLAWSILKLMNAPADEKLAKVVAKRITAHMAKHDAGLRVEIHNIAVAALNEMDGSDNCLALSKIADITAPKALKTVEV